MSLKLCTTCTLTVNVVLREKKIDAVKPAVRREQKQKNKIKKRMKSSYVCCVMLPLTELIIIII